MFGHYLTFLARPTSQETIKMQFPTMSLNNCRVAAFVARKDSPLFEAKLCAMEGFRENKDFELLPGSNKRVKEDVEFSGMEVTGSSCRQTLMGVPKYSSSLPSARDLSWGPLRIRLLRHVCSFKTSPHATSR